MCQPVRLSSGQTIKYPVQPNYKLQENKHQHVSQLFTAEMPVSISELDCAVLWTETSFATPLTELDTSGYK